MNSNQFYASHTLNDAHKENKKTQHHKLRKIDHKMIKDPTD